MSLPVEEDKERPGDYQVDDILGNPVSFSRVIPDLSGEGPLRNTLVPDQTETNVKTRMNFFFHDRKFYTRRNGKFLLSQY